MSIKGIGIDGHSSRIDGDLELLEADLAYFEKVGFDYVEIPVHGVDGVVGGRLNLRNTRRVKEALRRYNLKATVHGPNRLSQRMGDFELNQKIFRSSIEFTSELEAEIMVYHGGNFGTFKRARQIRQENQDLAELGEVEALRSLGCFAAERGVEICVENGTYPVEELVRIIEKVDRKNVGITFDFGHAFLFYNVYGIKEDFLPSIKKAAPFIKHIHIHDNFGKLTPNFTNDPLNDSYIDRLPFGEGDLHMPPGMGRIPYRTVIPLIKDYSGVATMEIKPRYKEFYPEALKMIKEIFEESQNRLRDKRRYQSGREAALAGV